MKEEYVYCTKCETPKPRVNFYNSRINKNGTGTCKSCELKYQRQQRKNKGESWLRWNREYVKKWRKEHPKRVKQLREAAKKNKPPRICPDCKVNVCWGRRLRCKICWLKNKDKQREINNERAKKHWKKKSKTWTEEDKKREAKRKHDWYVKNKQRILNHHKEYRDSHKEELRKQKKQYRERIKSQRSAS